MIRRIRVSYGSAVALGLIRGELTTRPTTIYLLLRHSRCSGRCAFCPQSIGSESRISRVDWPEFDLRDLKDRLGGRFERICVQCTDEEEVRRDLPAVVGEVSEGGIPLSVSTAPVTKDLMVEIKGAGAEVLTVPLDCAREDIFASVKGRDWHAHWRALRDAVGVFGRGRVGTHIIVGLGETERDVVVVLDNLAHIGVIPSLFAFTPVAGTPMGNRPRPALGSYRRLQVARYCIVELGRGADVFGFGAGGRIAKFPADLSPDTSVFMTKGCRGCNRPYFNERVSGPIFNYPYTPTEEEIGAMEGQGWQ